MFLLNDFVQLFLCCYIFLKIYQNLMGSRVSSTKRSSLENTYYMDIPLFVLDNVRILQDHPKYKNGIKIQDLVELLRQQRFANGDLESQIESAVRSLEAVGFIKYVNNKGYRTLGPYARLASAKTLKAREKVWEEIEKKF